MPDRTNGHPRPARPADHTGQRRRQPDSFNNVIEPLETRLLLARYAIIGDLATTSATTLPVVSEMVKSWNPEHIISVGDNNNDDDANFDATIGQYFHEYMDPYPGSHGAGSPTGNRLWPALGNHDFDDDGGLDAWHGYFTLPGNERYYTVRLGEVEFFMTSSDPREPDGNTATSVQGQWLQGALAASTATWKLVVAHHPPYSSAGSPDAEWMRWPFPEWGADAVISGHHHVYERLSVGGFPYIINSAMGAALGEFPAGETDPNSVFRFDRRGGAIQVDADAASLTLRFFERDNATTPLDTLTLTNGNAPAAPTKLVAGAVSAGRIDLSWADNSPDEAHFILERSPDGAGNWAAIATPAANATRYSDTSGSLLPGVTYHYRVRAAAAAGAASINSNTASAATTQPGYFNWIPRGATWKYHDGGVSQGSTWRAAAFDDSSWLAGRGQLGYGDGDEITTVSFGADPNLKHPTTYFRTGFTVADPAQVIQLDLSLLRDDGAVVYLNGTEIWRSNMPAGSITYTTLASSPQGGAEETTWLGLSISPALLIAGNNVIAAEVHQDNRGSSDLSFDFVLTARLAAAIAPPSAFKATAASPTLVELKWLDTVAGETGFKIERSTDGINFAQIGVAPAGATGYADATVVGNKQYWYRARSYNAAGDSRASSVATVTTPAPPSTIPAPWTSGDVGAVAAAGSASHNAGVFTVAGSGAGIGGTADEFHFLSQPWTGNGTIVVRVTGLTNTAPGARAGIMFRESLAAGARTVALTVSPSGVVNALARPTTGGGTESPPNGNRPAPTWLKLVRNGNVFSPFHSADGVTWTAMFTGNYPMSAGLYVGLCVTSNNDGTLATATFDNVSASAAVSVSATPRGGTRPVQELGSNQTSLTHEVGLKKDPLDPSLARGRARDRR